MAVERHPERGVSVLYNPQAELIGSRRQMKHCRVIQDLENTDDMVLVGNSMSDLEEMLTDLDVNCKGMGLIISAMKTKVMAVLPQPLPGQQQCQPPKAVWLGSAGEDDGVVDAFEYLGSTVTSDCSLDEEVNRRINKAALSFRGLSKV